MTQQSLTPWAASVMKKEADFIETYNKMMARDLALKQEAERLRGEKEKAQAGRHFTIQ